MNLEAFKECKTSSFLAHPQLFGNTSLQTKVFKESTSADVLGGGVRVGVGT